MAPIPFGESSTFAYDFPTAGLAPQRLSVRLLFRTVPPYFVRALGKVQPELGLERYIDAVEITEASRTELDLASAAISSSTVSQ